MPRQILPQLETLSMQVQGIISHYTRMLDDEFLFGSATQVPQVATIFDRIAQHRLYFHGDSLSLTELLTLIAYRYGFEKVQIMGHGGYAIVLGNRDAPSTDDPAQRRVLRLVPDHHVRNIIAQPDKANEFDVRLTDKLEPQRNPDYPLLLSDLFLMPRHTCKLIFYDESGEILQAGGYPAILHCQLLPEARAFNQLKTNIAMANMAGDILEAALATLGVSVADAHGGNGGALMDSQGHPLQQDSQAGLSSMYIPVVLDYGYYSRIGARTLASVLIRHGVSSDAFRDRLLQAAPDHSFEQGGTLLDFMTHEIDQSDLPRSHFGRLLYDVPSGFLNPYIWIDQAESHWKTAKEKAYPPLRGQSRLARLYPDYDEVIFPQRIEEYGFTV